MADDCAIEVQELVKRCRAGRPGAVGELIDRFKDRVFGLCFRMVNHVQDAEDMTQESFVRAIRSLHQWDPARPFAPWLMAIAGNRCRTLLAKRSRRPWDATAEVLEDATSSYAGLQASQRIQLAEEIELALCELREEYRTAFLLFHREMLSYDEIAEALGRPVGTVKTWVHRARKNLGRQLLIRGALEESPDGVWLQGV